MKRNLAENEGFEPPDLLQSTVFKTAAIDHSANSPCAKVQQFAELTNFSCFFLQKNKSVLAENVFFYGFNVLFIRK